MSDTPRSFEDWYSVVKDDGSCKALCEMAWSEASEIGWKMGYEIGIVDGDDKLERENAELRSRIAALTGDEASTEWIELELWPCGHENNRSNINCWQCGALKKAKP